MRHRLRRVGVLKAGIVGGIGYALMSLAFVPIFLFFVMLAPMMGGQGHMPGEWMMSGAFVLLLPLLYGFLGFVFTALGAAIYNLVAMMVGGLEIDLEPMDGPVERSAPSY